jgi:molybdopterin-containing oxidoreductase family iron-sulfur binding subunit
VVGEELIRVGREMNWLRIDRFVDGQGDALDVRHLPMLCQQCGSAPCETVCPVLATYHSPQGLNVMVYNRCIGTRYCNNNCPYKVRRFNFLPYDFYVQGTDKLRLNPDVTVRSKGVMEKCTFCVQRINLAVDQATFAGREVADGEIQTACQQACPSRAITFGNYKDPRSALVRLRQDPRAYTALAQLNTRPGVTYLKRIRRAPAAGAAPPAEHHG